MEDSTVMARETQTRRNRIITIKSGLQNADWERFKEGEYWHWKGNKTKREKEWQEDEEKQRNRENRNQPIDFYVVWLCVWSICGSVRHSSTDHCRPHKAPRHQVAVGSRCVCVCVCVSDGLYFSGACLRTRVCRILLHFPRAQREADLWMLSELFARLVGFRQPFFSNHPFQFCRGFKAHPVPRAVRVVTQGYMGYRQRKTKRKLSCRRAHSQETRDNKPSIALQRSVSFLSTRVCECFCVAASLHLLTCYSCLQV